MKKKSSSFEPPQKNLLVMKKLFVLVAVVASASLYSFPVCPTTEEKADWDYINAKRTGIDVKIQLSERRATHFDHNSSGHSEYECSSVSSFEP